MKTELWRERHNDDDDDDDKDIGVLVICNHAWARRTDGVVSNDILASGTLKPDYDQVSKITIIPHGGGDLTFFAPDEKIVDSGL